MADSGTRRREVVERSRELAESLQVDSREELVHVDSCDPGIERIRVKDGFEYRMPDGARVEDPAVLRRIEAIVIPPAWEDVWICLHPRGHLQATGRDARGRKQYRYHPQWRRHQEERKFDRMVPFGQALPSIRRRVAEDLGQRQLTRERMVALVVQLLDETLLRVGNREYRRDNETFGLTTLLDDHAEVGSRKVRFSFTGKSGKHVEVEVNDRRLARLVARSRDLPGQQLFQYVDDEGDTHAVGSSDVNDYLLETTGEHFTSKDFRTWGATSIVVDFLLREGIPESEKRAESVVVAAIKEAATALNNTPAVSRRSYVHPGVTEAYLGGDLEERWVEAAVTCVGECELLREEERVLLELLTRLA